MARTHRFPKDPEQERGQDIRITQQGRAARETAQDWRAAERIPFDQEEEQANGWLADDTDSFNDLLVNELIGPNPLIRPRSRIDPDAQRRAFNRDMVAGVIRYGVMWWEVEKKLQEKQQR